MLDSESYRNTRRICNNYSCFYGNNGYAKHYQREGREAGTNYRDSAFRKGARATAMLHMFVSFTVISLFVGRTNYPFQTTSRSLCNSRVSLSDFVTHFYPVCLRWLARIFPPSGTWARSQRACVNAIHCYVCMPIHCLFVSTLHCPNSASENPVITFFTTQFSIENILRSAHTLCVFMCFVRISANSDYFPTQH